MGIRSRPGRRLGDLVLASWADRYTVRAMVGGSGDHWLLGDKEKWQRVQ
jgi:hypothetical protein